MHRFLRTSLLLPLLLLALPARAQVDMEDTVAGAPPPALTDGQILHIFITANRGEIITSRPVADQLADADVRAFAERMVAEHSAVIEQAEALAADLPPEENLVSTSMTDMVQGVANETMEVDGAERDRTYIEAQVILHGHTLHMLDHVLIPSAENDELRALMEATRPAVENHLQQAKDLHRRMMDAGGS